MTWRFSGTGLPVGYPEEGSNVGTIQFDPTNPSVVFAGTGGLGVESGLGIYKSTDGGNSWFPSSSGLPNWSAILGIAINKVDPNLVFISVIAPYITPKLYKSTNGGMKWEVCMQFDRRCDAIMFDGGSPEYLRAVDAVGTMYYSANLGDTWRKESNGVDMRIVPQMIRVRPTGTYYMTSVYTGVFKSEDGVHIERVSEGLPSGSEQNGRYQRVCK